MKSSALGLILLGSLCAVVQTANAANCICIQVPMYPHPMNPSVWIHYASFCTDCVSQYPTSYMGPYTPPQTCTGNCVGCNPFYELQSGEAVKEPTPAAANEVVTFLQPAGEDDREAEDIPDMHFGSDQWAPPDLGAVNEGSEFKDYLNQHFGDGVTAPYGPDLTFRVPAGFTEPLVVSLQRNRASDGRLETFSAVIWEIVYAGEGTVASGYVGLEINGRPESSLQASSHHNAVVTTVKGSAASHRPIPGLLQVHVWHPGSKVAIDAFIRLHSVRDARGAYEPYKR